jgi:hypothetical protein
MDTDAWHRLVTAHGELEATAEATAAFIKELLSQLTGTASGHPDRLARVQTEATTATALLLEMDAGLRELGQAILDLEPDDHAS